MHYHETVWGHDCSCIIPVPTFFAYVIDLYRIMHLAVTTADICFLCSEKSHASLYPLVNHSKFSCTCLSAICIMLWEYMLLWICASISVTVFPIQPLATPPPPPVPPHFWNSNWLNKDKAPYQILIYSTQFSYSSPIIKYPWKCT